MRRANPAEKGGKATERMRCFDVRLRSRNWAKRTVEIFQREREKERELQNDEKSFRALCDTKKHRMGAEKAQAKSVHLRKHLKSSTR